MLTPAEIARGALVDAGYPELALMVGENHGGFAMMNDLGRALGGLAKMKPEGQELMVKAFWIGHLSAHPTAMLHHHEEACGTHAGICCNECHPGICE